MRFTPLQCKKIPHPRQNQSPRVIIQFSLTYPFLSKTLGSMFSTAELHDFDSPKKSFSMRLLIPEVQRSSPTEDCLISISQQLGRKVVFSPSEFYGYSSPQTDLIQKISPKEVIIPSQLQNPFILGKLWQFRAQIASTSSPAELLIFPTESEDHISDYFLSRVVIIFPQQEILFAFCM